MKWVLIILLSSNAGGHGYWDTGLTYRSFEDCANSATEIYESQHHGDARYTEGFEDEYQSYLRDRRLWKCVPKK
jgi:hypothetical protein